MCCILGKRVGIAPCLWPTKDLLLRVAAALQVMRAGIPPCLWLTKQVAALQHIVSTHQALQRMQLKQWVEPISAANATHRRVPPKQCIITFKDKEERMHLLRQSLLLKGKKLWIAEELTTHQLKSKSSELNKMHDARKQGKWAVYRGGKALIQEFRTPKPTPLSLDSP